MIHIEIFTRDGCVSCDNTKTMLNNGNFSYQEYKVDKDITREEVLKKFPKAKVLPILVVDGVVIQDINSFQMLLENNT